MEWGNREAAIVFFAYIGFDSVSTAVEKVRDPQKNLPIGIIGSLLISTILYIAVSAVLTRIVPNKYLNCLSGTVQTQERYQRTAV
jgi:APA family basic amino acid/polyamine antiporter